MVDYVLENDGFYTENDENIAGVSIRSSVS